MDALWAVGPLPPIVISHSRFETVEATGSWQLMAQRPGVSLCEGILLGVCGLPAALRDFGGHSGGYVGTPPPHAGALLWIRV